MQFNKQEYIWNGRELPGVTTVLKGLGWNTDMLIGWARREALKGVDPKKLSKSATDIGHAVHKAIELYATNGRAAPDLEEITLGFPEEDKAKAMLAWSGFLTWDQANAPEYLMCEKKCVHPELLFGGTIDIVARVAGIPCIIDIKTSSGVYLEYFIQVAAYRELLVRQEEINVHGNCNILHVCKKTGETKMHKIKDKALDSGWEIFQHLLGIYHSGLRGSKVEDMIQ